MNCEIATFGVINPEMIASKIERTFDTVAGRAALGQKQARAADRNRAGTVTSAVTLARST
jgi:hypothetical protein